MLVDQGVEVAMAVGKSGRRTLLVGVGVGDSTEGRVGGMASMPPSGANIRATAPSV